jgi:hypothetical protein
MITIKMNVTGDRQVQTYLAKLKRRTPEAGDDTAAKACMEMALIARGHVAPMKSGSGALRQSINYRRTSGSRESQSKTWTVDTIGRGKLANSKPIPSDQRPQHAYYQEYGFAPHPVHVSQLSPGPWKDYNEEELRDFVKVRRNTPYMSYARRKVLRRIRTISNRFIGKALRK